jgi:hypothetical protein
MRAIDRSYFRLSFWCLVDLIWRTFDRTCPLLPRATVDIDEAGRID